MLASTMRKSYAKPQPNWIIVVMTVIDALVAFVLEGKLLQQWL
jgi:hypothetical protein